MKADETRSSDGCRHAAARRRKKSFKRRWMSRDAKQTARSKGGVDVRQARMNVRVLSVFLSQAVPSSSQPIQPSASLNNQFDAPKLELIDDEDVLEQVKGHLSHPAVCLVTQQGLQASRVEAHSSEGVEGLLGRQDRPS